MADFCADCTEKIMHAPRELNDFRHDSPHGLAVVLCEGCGFHVVDRAGERLCGENFVLAAVEPGSGLGACGTCAELVNAEGQEQGEQG